MNIKTMVGSMAAGLVLCANAQGLTQAQIDQGCVQQGQYIRCPGQMQRLTTEEPRRLTTEEPRRITTEEPRRITTEEPRRITAEEPRRITAKAKNWGMTVEEPGRQRPQTMARIKDLRAGSGVPQITSSNQKGLSKQYRDAGCVIAGEYIECPGGIRKYRQTFEIPQFGRNWQIYIPGVAYQTENTVDGTRWLHTSAGAGLPNNTLKIAANGAYYWNADGKLIQGRWVQADEGTLVLQQAYKGVDWNATTEKLGADENGHLVLWQGNEQLKGQ